MSVWVDAIICDYNYVFDPKVYLRRHFNETERPYCFLIDEAHNLVDRAREYFSPRLTAMFKPTEDHSLRVSFNKAFRSPSAVNNSRRSK